MTKLSNHAEPQWGTIPEAAEHLKVSVPTIRRYIRDGRLDATRMGPRLIRVDMASLRSLGSSVQRPATATNIDEYIKRLVEAAPPLTPEQRDKLAALLRPTS